MEKLYIKEIQEEYKKIDERWLHLHFKTAFGLVIFICLIECGMGIILYQMGEIHSTIPIYLFKYLIAPCVLNLFFIVIAYATLHDPMVSQTVKIYMISLLFVVICFVVFSVHIIFSTLYFIFAVPILLTVVYGSYSLTGITAGCSMFCVIISELFIKWDSEKLSILSDGNRLAEFIISLCILLGFSFVCMIVIHFGKEKNTASIQKELERYKLKQTIQIDELTGIHNRKALRDAIYTMEMDESDSSYILVMIDLDDFKKLNDTLGHIKGDQCLIEFGKILKENSNDAMTFRYGGDEFCILFQNQMLQDVVKICQRIQYDLEKANIGKEFEFPLTASFGIAVYSKHMDSAELFMNTDKALYESKVKKNAIRIFEELEA
ncbi:MAG: GGDEF domain-containing protein [Velocimicrobium sp.]